MCNNNKKVSKFHCAFGFSGQIYRKARSALSETKNYNTKQTKNTKRVGGMLGQKYEYDKFEKGITKKRCTISIHEIDGKKVLVEKMWRKTITNLW